jgi:hypothetical protein
MINCNLRKTLKALLTLFIFSIPLTANCLDENGKFKSEIITILDGSEIIRFHLQEDFRYAEIISHKFFKYIYLSSDYSANKGYEGITELAVFLDENMEIVRVLILRSDDTPSFVRRVNNNSFLNQFLGKGYQKSIQTISGATVTCNAISSNVKKSMEMIVPIIKKNSEE